MDGSPTRRAVLKGTAAFGLATLAAPALARTQELRIISNRGNADQRAALEKIAQAFGAEAGVEVSVNNMDHEAHKTAIRNYLVAGPPDICFWFSGERMRNFVQRGLFGDITDLVEREGWADVVPSLGSTTVDGRQYGLPTGGIMWGLWYRESQMTQAGLTIPQTFDDLFTYASAAQDQGLIPFAMGTKNMWPAAGWFDHMNHRINGLEHHLDLMAGRIAYTDASVQKVMAAWAELVEAGLFTPNATSYNWEGAAAQVVQGRAGIIDLGNFVSYAFPEDQRDDLRFAPFPQIDAAVPRCEDYSSDSIHIPAQAPNPDVAREFLAYFYRAENLGAYLAPEGNVPARTDVTTQNSVVEEARKGLAGVAGTSQYFDRDTDPDVAQAGLKGFQEFMVRPGQADRILSRIEQARTRAYGAL